MKVVPTNPLRPVLLAASRSPRIERGVSAGSMTRTLVDRFVAGESVAAVVPKVRGLVSENCSVTVDYLGEDITGPDRAEHVVDQYLTLIRALAQLATNAREGSVRRNELSVKLSALGQSLPGGDAIAREHARTIVRAAEAADLWVTFDAEDHTTTESTLSIVRALRRDYPDTVGTVLQAYLHRTESDCREFAATGARIRLCKGAYDEPATVAYRRKSEVDASYVRCLRILMAGNGYPMVATHDPAMISTAALLAAATGRGADEVEYQMLYGVRADEQARLVQLGQHVRVYVPFGDQWYGYFVRRLAERPANLMFFARSLLPRG